MAATGYGWSGFVGATRGYLGVGDTLSHSTPTIVALPGGTQLTKIVSATADTGETYTTLMLVSDGTVYACGSNGAGRLGNGSTDSSNHATPALISGLTGIVDIAIGQAAFALDGSGNLYGWGANASGTLGLGNTTATNSPTLVQTGVASMAAGSQQSALRLTGGQVYTCGKNDHGALGQGATIGAVVNTWTAISGSDVISSVAVGADQILYILADGTVKASGNGGSHGSLGPTIAALSGSDANVPTVVDNLSSIVEGFVWGGTSAFRDSSGGVFMYGMIRPGGGDGTAGAGDYTSTPDVISLPSGVTYTALAYVSGASFSGASVCAYGAIGSDGKLWTWGYGGLGHMGSGSDPTTNASPVSINGLSTVIAACRTGPGMHAVGVLGGAAVVTGNTFAAIVG